MASFGETLRRERELREITLRQVAEATKINLRYLEALEHDRFEVLPGGLFNKGFIRAYAIYIGVDPEAMVDSYLHAMAARVDAGAPCPPARGDGGLHRPADLPTRRAAPGAAGAGGSRPVPAIRFASPGDGAVPPARPLPAAPAAPGPGKDGSAANRPRPPRISAQQEVADAAGHRATNRPPAVQTIAEAAPRSAERPRALLGVLLLVGGAALIFVLLGLISGRGPGARHAQDPIVTSPLPADAAEAAPETGPATGAAGEIVIAPGSIAAAGETATPAATPATAGATVIGLPLPGSLPAPSPESPAGIPAAPARSTPAPVRPIPPPPIEIASVAGAPPPAREEDGRDSRGPAPDSMQLELTATFPTFVNVVCDQRNVIYSTMAAGETRALTCRSVIKISAHDAGAVQLRVNGADCMPMGEPGARAFGYTIRIDDFERICRPAGRRFDGRS